MVHGVRSVVWWGIGVLLLGVLGGCGGYTLQGRVVQGSAPVVMLVPADDQALAMGDPVSGASVALLRDPDRLSRAEAASARTTSTGHFALSVDAFGAGWMDEDWAVRADAQGHQTVEQMLRLPRSTSGVALLIVLPPGGMRPSQENLLDEYERYR